VGREWDERRGAVEDDVERDNVGASRTPIRCARGRD
jgi:hypothetical protein